MFLGNDHRAALFLFLVMSFAGGSVFAFEAEDYEEAAGLAFAVHGNPGNGSWEFGFEDGTWLVGTPLFGKAFLHAARFERTDAWYGGLGMIFRLMPHWSVAPFLGAGGGYYHPWSSSRDTASDRNAVEPRSFWAGRVECGFRVDLPGGQPFVEATAGYTWVGTGDDLNFGSLGVAYGQRW